MRSFTQPTTPISGGAPQKIAYLAADYFRKKGIADKSNVIFATFRTVIFGEAYCPYPDGGHQPLRHSFQAFYAPHRIDSENKIIHFKHSAPEENRW